MSVSLRARRIPEWKLKMALEIARLAREHRTFIVVDLTGVPAKHVQMLRKRLSRVAVLKVVKPKVALKAFESIDLSVEDLRPHMTGQIMLVFSNLNVFELANMVENFVTYDYYGPGEVVDKEVVIPEGNTGLPAGPILSVFGRLKIPTKVQGNIVYVAKDTVVTKPGDTVSVDLAALLQKLGLALKEVRAKVKCGRDGNLVLHGEKLKLNVVEHEELVKIAVTDALKLALELVLPEPAILKLAIVKAEKHALAIVSETGFIARETAEYVIHVAHLKALALAAEVSKYAPELGLERRAPVQQPITQETPPKPKLSEEEKKEESKELSEEALAEGFTALFG